MKSATQFDSINCKNDELHKAFHYYLWLDCVALN